jgi:acyl-lipid omega-3 desaturase
MQILIDPQQENRTDSELPFTLQQLKAAIPAYCFEPSTRRSLAYFFLDIGIIAALYSIAVNIDAWWFYPIFWVAQGTMFWALFVVGHDCGHGSFSKHKWLNNVVGHLAHTPILVPYHGWRISHRTHHANTGNLDTDESWYPVSEEKYNQMGFWEKFARFYALLVMYPVYLFKRSPGRQGTHFSPNSPLFRPNEKNDVLTSTGAILGMVALLAGFTLKFGFLAFLKFYFVPYVIFVIWLDLVTFLHHTEADIPWYRDADWFYLKGALSTIDRDYGLFNPIHHNIGTHVAHHIFSNMPHYHLKTATEAIKPILGSYYRVSNEPIWKSFLQSYRNCHFVPDQGMKVYYQPYKR